MALDATILDVTRDGADLVLTLGPRIDDADKLFITGQPKLRILNATWTPEPGMDIWGGGSSAQIITKRGERDRISVYVEPDGGAFHAFNPAFQGLHVDGSTAEEAVRNFAQAVPAYLESLLKHGDPVTNNAIGPWYRRKGYTTLVEDQP